jgi:hypothetical protein
MKCLLISLSWHEISFHFHLLIWNVFSSPSPDIRYHFISISWHRMWGYLPLLTWNVILSSSADMESDVTLICWYGIWCYLLLEGRKMRLECSHSRKSGSALQNVRLQNPECLICHGAVSHFIEKIKTPRKQIWTGIQVLVAPNAWRSFCIEWKTIHGWSTMISWDCSFPFSLASTQLGHERSESRRRLRSDRSRFQCNTGSSGYGPGGSGIEINDQSSPRALEHCHLWEADDWWSS